jgi:hypothetical protein
MDVIQISHHGRMRKKMPLGKGKKTLPLRVGEYWHSGRLPDILKANADFRFFLSNEDVSLFTHDNEIYTTIAEALKKKSVQNNDAVLAEIAGDKFAQNAGSLAARILLGTGNAALWYNGRRAFYLEEIRDTLRIVVMVVDHCFEGGRE